MATSRVIHAVVANFLGTFLSRYSDHEGYWLFGFLVSDLQTIRIDLLNPSTDERPVFQRAVELAALRFREQLQRNGVAPGGVSAAVLHLTRGNPQLVEVNGSMTTGWENLALVSVESKGGRQFKAEGRIVVAPHNAVAEHRSARTAPTDQPSSRPMPPEE
jgi:hypothetical protein